MLYNIFEILSYRNIILFFLIIFIYHSRNILRLFFKGLYYIPKIKNWIKIKAECFYFFFIKKYVIANPETCDNPSILNIDLIHIFAASNKIK